MSFLATVTNRLEKAYGTPSLGNFKDPVKEIFYILLSARTTESLYKRAHQNLFNEYPSLTSIASAKINGIWHCIKIAGLGKKRARQIQLTAERLLNDFGPKTRGYLRAMTASSAYEYLVSLPGLGPKSALCIMMYSLNADVFPVDVNVRRILERLGILSANLKHYQAQAIAPAYVPRGRSLALHIGLVEHGRKICLPQNEKCDICILGDLCKHRMRVAKKSSCQDQ